MTAQSKAIVSVDLLRSLESKNGVTHICVVHYSNGEEELREVSTKEFNSKYLKHVNRNGRSLAYGVPANAEIR